VENPGDCPLHRLGLLVSRGLGIHQGGHGSACNAWLALGASTNDVSLTTTVQAEVVLDAVFSLLLSEASAGAGSGQGVVAVVSSLRLVQGPWCKVQ
jgi:hypothetical protein